MRNHIIQSAKMLICFVGRYRGELLVEAGKAAGARGGTLAFGTTLCNNRILQALSMADVQQDVVFTVMGTEAPAVVQAIKKAAALDPKRLSGSAVLLGAPELFIRKTPQNQDQDAQPSPEGKRNPKMSGYKLITIIINAGYAIEVMVAARQAGATGGTILNARGTGTKDDMKFFSISLVPEKEMLLIVAAEDKVKDIVAAVGNVPKLCEPGGGILFNINVEEFIRLGEENPCGV